MRHGYSEDLDQQDLAMWRGRVASSIRGKRGQKMLRDLAAAMDSMPTRELVRGSLQTSDGQCCAIGRACEAKGIDLKAHEGDDECDLMELNADIAGHLDIAECLVQEIEYVNDEYGPHDETPAQRWQRVRRWIDRHIPTPPGASSLPMR